MKIGYDISQTAHIGGVATYTQNLAAQLSSQPDLDTVFFYTSLRKPYRGKLPNVKSFPVPPTFAEILFNRWRILPIENFIGPIDIFHSSDWIQPKTKAKKVTTYHDVVPLKYPQWSHPKIVAVHERRLKLVEIEIDQVIAVSEAAKKDLLEVSKIPEEKITVIYEGVDPVFKPQNPQAVAQFRKKLKLPEKFILAIGGIGERRNLGRIREAVKNYPLVITGQSIPWVGSSEMPLLYAAAEVLLYPSLYEGFGLPILEAMACGTPVITSNVSSMPEVAGKAALLVDPTDIEQISEKVKEVMGNNQLRQKLIKDGFDQSAEFTWEKCVRKTMEVYRKLL